MKNDLIEKDQSKVNVYLLAAALAFLIIIPTIIISLMQYLYHTPPINMMLRNSNQYYSVETSTGYPFRFTAVFTFSIGWLLLGATIKPWNSVWRGVAIAAFIDYLMGAVVIPAFLWSLSVNDIVSYNRFLFNPHQLSYISGFFTWPLLFCPPCWPFPWT